MRIEELFSEKVMARLRRIARAKDRRFGEDALQRACLEVWEKIQKDRSVLEEIENENYLLRRLDWRLGDLRSQEANGGLGVALEETFGLEDSRIADPERELDVRERLAVARRVVAGLKDRDREVIEFCLDHYEEHGEMPGTAEIAELLGIKYHSAGSVLSRAWKRFRDLLEEAGVRGEDHLPEPCL